MVLCNDDDPFFDFEAHSAFSLLPFSFVLIARSPLLPRCSHANTKSGLVLAVEVGGVRKICICRKKLQIFVAMYCPVLPRGLI